MPNLPEFATSSPHSSYENPFEEASLTHTTYFDRPGNLDYQEETRNPSVNRREKPILSHFFPAPSCLAATGDCYSSNGQPRLASRSVIYCIVLLFF